MLAPAALGTRIADGPAALGVPGTGVSARLCLMPASCPGTGRCVSHLQAPYPATKTPCSQVAPFSSDLLLGFSLVRWHRHQLSPRGLPKRSWWGFAHGKGQTVCFQWQLGVAGVEGGKKKQPTSVHVSSGPALLVHLQQPPLPSHHAVMARSHHTSSGHTFIQVLYAMWGSFSS